MDQSQIEEATKPSLQMTPDSDGYWYELIDTDDAAKFVGLVSGTLANLRMSGGGPKYIQLSARCIRYTRADLRDWAEARKRTSTSDLGEAA